MQKQIPNGVYPTMLTPFTNDNKVDFAALEQMIDWYAQRGVAGLFAICQSSEIFFLSFEERLEVLKFIMEKVPKGISVIASGHTADDLETQIKEAKQFIETGIDAYVFISNRFAAEDEDDNVFLKNMLHVADSLPDIPLGVYECPYPYKRLLSPAVVRKMADDGRFQFLKDTCCDLVQLEEKLKAAEGSNFKIYNANSATLLDSLVLGCAGFSGVMANFHPELYVELCDVYKENAERARLLQNFVGFFSVAECQVYPVNAKYHMTLDGLDMTINTRSRNIADFPHNRQLEIQQMRELTLLFKEYLKTL